MKKLIFLVIIVLGTIGFVNGQQLGNPIKPYRESGYTPSEVKAFALGSSQVSVDYRNEMLRIVNNALAASGESMVVDETNISWILDNVHSEHVDLGGSYKNSRILNGSFNIYNDRDNFSGSVAEFRYGKCKVILYKLICMNLLDVRRSNFSQQRQPEAAPVADITSNTTSTFVPSVVLKSDYINPPVVNPSILGLNKEVREKTFFGKNWWWIVPVGIGIGTGIGLLLDGDDSEGIEPRSMPPGIDVYTPGGNGGVDSDPRGMPSGSLRKLNFGPPVQTGIPIFRF